MNKAIKGAAIVALSALSLGLGACSNESTAANANATPDPADLTAASIDQEAGTVEAPSEPAPTDTATGSEAAPTESPAH